MSSHEQPVYLENVGDVRVVEVSTGDANSLRHVHCGGIGLPANIGIYHPLPGQQYPSGTESEPYYSLEWDSDVTDSGAIDSIRQIASNRQLDEFYTSGDYDVTTNTRPTAGGETLEAALIPNFVTVGVYLYMLSTS
jgi:hypothetical protein